MSLIVPETARPTNLHLPPSATARVVDSDLYDICKRVEEISPRLFILLLEGDATYSYAIMEHCDDHVDRLVYRVKELDGRVLKKLQKMQEMPLDVRYKQLEKEEFKMKEEIKEEELDSLYESMGRPMWTELERTGFTQRGVSYPKRGIKGVAGYARR